VLYYNFFYCLPHAGGSTSAIVNKIKQGFRKDSNQIQQAKQWRAIYKAYLFIIFYFTDLISHNGKKKKIFSPAKMPYYLFLRPLLFGTQHKLDRTSFLLIKQYYI